MSIEQIFILHHTHVDVGYTDLQPVIYDRHVEFIDQALDLCAQTDDYPEDARFRWINEFSWPVMQFLQKRPERGEELYQRCREGRVEVCGLYLDPTELCDRRAFEESLKPALTFSQQCGVAASTVMTSDVPGQAWSLPDVLAEQGFRFLCASPNPMVSKPVEVTRPFYWIGPQGNRVLVWLSDWRKGWYGEGHVLGFLQGQDSTRQKLAEYLDLLNSEGYPWKILALHLAADNYPPFEGLSDLVAGLNEAGDLPKMRISTNREFFERLVELHEGEFASHRAAWPDWWSNGLGSAAFESGLSRETHCRLHRVEVLQEVLEDRSDTWPIFEDLLLFDEHTWGASNSALQPHGFKARAAWTYKSAYIYRAVDAARRLETNLAQRLSSASDAAVYNPLEEAYLGPVELPAGTAVVRGLTTEEKTDAPVQDSAATPLSAKTRWTILQVAPGATRALTMKRTRSAHTREVTCEGGALQNEFYRIDFDPKSGLVTSLLDLEAGVELLDKDAPHGFAETVHERIAGSKDRNAIWERGQTTIPYGKRHTDAPFIRKGASQNARLLKLQRGPVFGSVTWRSRLPEVRSLETEIRLWRGLRRIDVEVRMHKQPQEKYESLYVAFPMALSNPHACIHSGGAVFKAEEEQLPGTCRDFYAVEDFVALEGEEGWAVLVPVDAPLVQLGQINTGRWLDHLTLERGSLYSWPVNNFWYTNFPGYQQGILRFRYSLTTGAGKLQIPEAQNFGRAVRVGVVVR